MPVAQKILEDGVRLERAGLLDRALAAYRSVSTRVDDVECVADALTHEADVHRTRCQWDESLHAARKAQAVAREARLPRSLAEAMIAEANVFISQGDFGPATVILNGIVSSSDDPRIRGIVTQNLGTILAEMGQLGAAERAFGTSLAFFKQAGYVRGEVIALNNFGRLALDRHDPIRAQPLLEQAFQLGRQIEDHELAAMAGLNLASALCSNGELRRAQDLAMSALGYFTMCQNSWREIECLRLIGDINERCDDFGNALRCCDLALRRARDIGAEVEEGEVQARVDALTHHLDGMPTGAQAIA